MVLVSLYLWKRSWAVVGLILYILAAAATGFPAKTVPIKQFLRGESSAVHLGIEVVGNKVINVQNTLTTGCNIWLFLVIASIFYY